MSIRRSDTADNDALLDSYIGWREESVEVEQAYRRWKTASSAQRDPAYLAYARALDREELAAVEYELLLERATPRVRPV